MKAQTGSAQGGWRSVEKWEAEDKLHTKVKCTEVDDGLLVPWGLAQYVSLITLYISRAGREWTPVFLHTPLRGLGALCTSVFEEIKVRRAQDARGCCVSIMSVSCVCAVWGNRWPQWYNILPTKVIIPNTALVDIKHIILKSRQCTIWQWKRKIKLGL